MVKEVFGDFASWRHKKDENDRTRAKQNFELMKDPQTYPKQLDYLRKRLTDEPAYQTFFVLDGAHRQAEVRRPDRLRREHERPRLAAGGDAGRAR